MMFNRDFPVVARQYAGNETNMTDQLVQLVKAVCDNKLESQTIAYDNFKRQFAALPIHFPSTKTIEGEIVYIDAYYNAITNIPIDMFKEAVHDGPFQAIISSKKDWQCQVYHDNYQPDEEIYLTQNALGCLEITLYQGAVSVLADLKVGDKITIKY